LLYAVPVTVTLLGFAVTNLQKRVAALEKALDNVDDRLAEVEAKTATMV